jgi:argininosuccinate lyase
VLTDYGRGKGLKLGDIPYAEAARIYREQTQQALPLPESVFREVISAEYMVFGRKGIGGPQPAEVQRMLTQERSAVAADRDWLKDRLAHLTHAQAGLDAAFSALAAQ